MNDMVNHPSHYTDGKYEVIDFIESHYFPYHLGNAIKYICRAGKKDPTKEVEDLEKAKWYLERFIKNPKAFKQALYLTKRSQVYWDEDDNGIERISAEDFVADKFVDMFGDKYPNRSAAIVLITSSMHAPDVLESYLDIQGAIECVNKEINEVLDRIDGRGKDDSMQRLCKNLKIHLKELDMTQTEFARLCHISYTALNGAINGHVRISGSRYDAIITGMRSIEDGKAIVEKYGYTW